MQRSVASISECSARSLSACPALGRAFSRASLRRRLPTLLRSLSRALRISRQAGLTTRVCGSTGSSPRCGSASRPNSSLRYLKTFSWAQRERMSPATCAADRLGCVVMTDGWRWPAAGTGSRGWPLLPGGCRRRSIQKRTSRASQPGSRGALRSATCASSIAAPKGERTVTRSGRNSLSGQRSVCAPLRQGDAGNALGGQPAEQLRAPAFAVEHQRQVRLRRRARGGRQQAERLQLRHDAVADLGHHLRIDLLVDAQQGRAAERVEPVAGRGRQLQFLARDEVLGQVGLAAVELDMAIDEQRGGGGGIVRGPLPGQGRAPGVQRLGVGGQLVQLAPQGARLGAAVPGPAGAPHSPGCS